MKELKRGEGRRRFAKNLIKVIENVAQTSNCPLLDERIYILEQTCHLASSFCFAKVREKGAEYLFSSPLKQKNIIKEALQRPLAETAWLKQKAS